MKIVETVKKTFKKTFKKFFSQCELAIILREDRKKGRQEIFARELQISNLKKIG